VICPVGDYLDSDTLSSSHSSGDYAHKYSPGLDSQGNDGPSSVNGASETSPPIPDSPPTPALVLQHLPDASITAPKVVFTIDIEKANFIPRQVRRTHARLWSLRYPARSFQYRIDHLQKLILEKVAKLKKTTRNMLELDYWIFMDTPSHKRHEDRVAKKIALAVTMETQQEEIRKLEFELESNKDMLDYKENGGKNSMTLLSIS
jgi:hypothetical protein